jgi:hypothetical protein
MAKEFLHGSNVVARLEQMRRKRMPEGVATGPLRYSRPADCLGHRPLNDRFVQVKTGRRAKPGIMANAASGKYKLPRLFSRSVGILSIQG